MTPGQPLTPQQIDSAAASTRLFVRMMLVLVGVAVFLVLDLATNVGASFGPGKRGGAMLALVVFVPLMLLSIPLGAAAAAAIRRKLAAGPPR